jgi:hypothetical protein
MYLQSGYNMLYAVKCIHLKHITKSTVWNEKNKKREKVYVHFNVFANNLSTDNLKENI